MIKIVVEKVRVSSGLEGIVQETVNVAADGLAAALKKRVAVKGSLW